MVQRHALLLLARSPLLNCMDLANLDVSDICCFSQIDTFFEKWVLVCCLQWLWCCCYWKLRNREKSGSISELIVL
ncbi:hypothetical protein ACOSQ2_032412 [Xanthoceras sorbifolium]